MPGTNVVFNGNSLQTDNIISQLIDHAGIPEKTMNAIPLAHGNRSVIPFIDYPMRTVKVKGIIIDTSIAALDNRLDVFKAYFNGKNQNLDIDYGGGTRRYTATASGLIISRPDGLNYAGFELTFMCTEPFGYDITSTLAFTANAITTIPYSAPVTFLGSAPIQRPIIKVTFTANSGTTNPVIIGNGSTGQSITTAHFAPWAATDVLIVDCFKRTVKINGVEVLYTGAFPEFKPGAGTVTYTDNLASRTFNLEVSYTKGWL